jgi:hypothetical protein
MLWLASALNFRHHRCAAAAAAAAAAAVFCCLIVAFRSLTRERVLHIPPPQRCSQVCEGTAQAIRALSESTRAQLESARAQPEHEPRPRGHSPSRQGQSPSLRSPPHCHAEWYLFVPEIGTTRKSAKGLKVKGQSPRWWGCVAVTFPIARMQMRLRKREHQIASAVAVVAVAIAAVVIVVVVVDGVGVNGCVASASAPEVHVLPSQGRQRRASRGGGVFPRGRQWRWSDPMVVE